MQVLTARLSAILAVLALFWAGAVNAASFFITYDDNDDQTIGTDNIVGSGTFSYDGPVSVGTFALSALSNIAFSATFTTGETFGTSDILTDLDFSGVSVFDAGGGVFGLVFTGDGGQTNGGSLDLANGNLDILTHEPTDFGIDDPIGCCGGDGMVNRYFVGALDGDYQALTAPIPLPGAVWLLIGGLASLLRFCRT